jgi:hypothetical protein
MRRPLQQQTDEMVKKSYKSPSKMGPQCISRIRRIFLMPPIASV